MNLRRLFPLLLCLALLLTGCGVIVPDEDSTAASPAGETAAAATDPSAEDVIVVEAPGAKLTLSTDTWDIPVGEERDVLFTLEAEGLTEAPVLVCETGELGVFEAAEQGGYALRLPLSSQIRDRLRCRAVCGQESSNEVLLSFYRAPTESEQAYMDDYIAQLQEAYSAAAPARDPSEAELTAALENLKPLLSEGLARGLLSYYEPFVGGLYLEFSNGLFQILPLMEFSGCWASSVDELAEDFVEQTATEEPEIVNTENKKIGVFLPYYSEHPCEVFPAAGEKLAAANPGYSCEVIRQGSMDFLRHLDRYDVLLWEGHNFNIKDTEVFYLLIPMSPDEIETLSGSCYAADLGVRMAINGARDAVYVSSDFFRKYYSSRSLDGMLVWLGICSGAKLEYHGETGQPESQRNLFTDLGAAICIAATNQVTVEYTDDMTEAFFDAFAAGFSPAQAMRSAQREHGATLGEYYNAIEIWLSGLGKHTKLDPECRYVIIDNPEYEQSAYTYTLPHGQVQTASYSQEQLDRYELSKINWTWEKLKNYAWDSFNFYESQMGGNTFAEGTLGDVEYLFTVPGYPAAPYARPTEMNITTRAGYVMGYGDVCLFGELHNGFDAGQTLLALNAANAAQQGDVFRLYNLGGSPNDYFDVMEWEVYDTHGHRFVMQFSFRNNALAMFRVTKEP